MPEIEKALAELKRLMEYRMEMGAKDEDFRGLGLTSRRNLCLHPEVSISEAFRLCTLEEVPADPTNRSARRKRAKWSTLAVEISRPRSLARRVERNLAVCPSAAITRSVLTNCEGIMPTATDLLYRNSTTMKLAT